MLCQLEKNVVLLKEPAKSQVEAMVEAVLTHVKGFKPLDSSPSDVGFI
jgi:hypothetical protein